MSRCFPYPPPGYVRNPVAVAEVEATTKLQKEREKTEKKKEKRNDKKALQQGGETLKHSKRAHKKRKHEDISGSGQESRKSKQEDIGVESKESIEQLEKSGLSEEHGAPCFIQTVHASPESSQDSSKRRKVILPSPSQNKNGNILRIKIIRDQDSPAAMLQNSRVLEQPPVNQMVSGSSLLNKQNVIQRCNNIVMGKSAAAPQQSIKSDSQAVLKQVNTHQPSQVIQRVDTRTMANVMQKIEPRLSVKASKGRVNPPAAKVIGSFDPSPAPAKVMGSVDPSPAKLTRRVDPPPAKTAPGVDATVLRKVDPSMPPSNEIRRAALPSSSKVLQNKTGSTAFCQPDMQLPPLQQKSKLPMETSVIKPQQTKASLPKEETGFSGRKTDAAAVPEVKQSKSDRKRTRKADKKEKKFRDLFVTWNPPSFEIQDIVDLGDQDWLLGSTSKPDASMSDCTASDGFQAAEQQSSLQPRAIHLPDLHVYQLPYVVPF